MSDQNRLRRYSLGDRPTRSRKATENEPPGSCCSPKPAARRHKAQLAAEECTGKVAGAQPCDLSKPVVVGLALYVLLSRSGPLGAFHLLFTPGAMVLAQALLALPIVTALVHSAAAHSWAEYGAALQVDGATRLQSIPHLLAITRSQLITAVLAGFGRTISEVGAILIVGGNIAGYTRTMTTAIVLETSKGDLSLGLGLGFVLIPGSVSRSARRCSRLAPGRAVVGRHELAAAILIASAILADGPSQAEET